MLYLFILTLLSSCSFSLYLYFSVFVINPFVYVLIGWSTAVAAFVLSRFFDLLKFNVLNRNFQAFVINGEGEYWDGVRFTSGEHDTEPQFSYNELQIERVTKKIINETGNRDLYVRVMPQEVEE